MRIAAPFLFVSVKKDILVPIKKSIDAQFYGRTHSALARKGRFFLGLLCFSHRLTQTIMPFSISKTHPHRSVRVSTKL
jgi:hypothetical protein